jgi:quercetin dioxygenase-like cupin family protein
MYLKKWRLELKVLNYTDMEPAPVTHEEAEGVTIRRLIAKEDGAPNFAMRLFEVNPGGHTPLHTHEWEHEVFVVDGEGIVWKDGEDVPIGSGTTIFVPPGEKHCFKNPGSEIFRFICLVPVEHQ